VAMHDVVCCLLHVPLPYTLSSHAHGTPCHACHNVSAGSAFGGARQVPRRSALGRFLCGVIVKPGTAPGADCWGLSRPYAMRSCMHAGSLALFQCVPCEGCCGPKIRKSMGCCGSKIRKSIVAKGCGCCWPRSQRGCVQDHFAGAPKPWATLRPSLTVLRHCAKGVALCPLGRRLGDSDGSY
jgi:hypothetical protein